MAQPGTGWSRQYIPKSAKPGQDRVGEQQSTKKRTHGHFELLRERNARICFVQRYTLDANHVPPRRRKPVGAIAMMTRALLSTTLLVLALHACLAQGRDVVCRAGVGSFLGKSSTGVTVEVGAQKTGGLDRRICNATLAWDKDKDNETLNVASGVPQIDLDVFEGNLAGQGPAAAFTVTSSDTQCCPAYQIYSLETPPRLLRTITGGSFYRASDDDLDGRIEIWTDDALAVEGFDGIASAELLYPPVCVLRLENGRLLDAGAEFQPHFDRMIATIRAEIDAGSLRDFKASDGRLEPGSASALKQLHALRVVKVQILGMVWAYLYSGREEKAWQSLAELWPAGDVERIRAAILAARARGIRSQVEGDTILTKKKKKRTTIFDANDGTPPSTILLQLPPPSDLAGQHALQGEVQMDLIIDSAGKVQSAEAGKDDLTPLTVDWKFVPALHRGRAVACHMRTVVAYKR